MSATELEKLAYALADTMAASELGSHCVPVFHVGIRKFSNPWYDTSRCGTGMKRYVKRAVRYLELRGMLVRHPERPELARARGHA